jgi:hypothetical protein
MRLRCRRGASRAMAVQLDNSAPIKGTDVWTYIAECCVRRVELAAGVWLEVELLRSSPASASGVDSAV